MNHKNITYFAALIIIAALMMGCSNTKETQTENACLEDACSLASSTVNEINIDKLEIYHFHETRQCYSCITVGDYAEETVNTYFADELESGKIVFGHINAELPENMELAEKYQVSHSSLMIGIYDKENGFDFEENVKVWYKIKDKQDYMDYLKEVIEQNLAGE